MGCDTINDLPDPVLLDILSLLQTKDAIVTSLLSKRSLWRYLPKLEFHDKSFRRVKFFLQFVDAALLLVDLKSVKTFVLKCKRSYVPHVKINIWLNAVLNHNSITHLELDFRKLRVNVSSSVFMCNTISVLKLTRVQVSNLSRVNLPALKVLHLEDVGFQYSQCLLSMLLSNCLHLEELVIKDTFLHVHGARDFGRFERLMLADIPPSLFLEDIFPNVQFLNINERFGYPRFYMPMPILHNLIHLEIIDMGDENWTILRCLRSFPNLQSLIVRNVYHRYNDRYFSEVEEGFEVPTCVSSHLKEFALFNFEGRRREFEFVRFVMEKARILSTVIVGSPNADKGKGLEILKQLSSYPRCSAKCRLIFDLSEKDTLDEEMSKLLTIRRSFAAPSFGLL
ncbi:hypothetical protein K1719_020814 [Acacia pycnantha]|nr:hypothetical protein K1719_020814 [Acacia pycnantha]